MNATAPKRIALLVESSHGTGRDIVHGVGEFLREQGCDWLIDHETQRLERAPPAWLAKWRGDGVIARLHSEQVARAVARLRVPAVDVLNALPAAPGVHLAHVDEAAIARLAFEHLRMIGLRQFAFVGPVDRTWARQRRDVFTAAAAEAGMPVHFYELAKHLRVQELASRRAQHLVRWLRDVPRPVGVLAANDSYAWLVSTACRLAGLAVPDDVAILGVDNDEVFCSLARPPMSSVVTAAVRLGFEAARLMDAILREGDPRDRREIVAPVLGVKVRASTDTLATDDEDVKEALALIRRQGSGKISVNAIAEAVGLSVSTLQRKFRTILGHGVHEESIRHRLQTAMRLLSDTDLSILAVAHRAGFGHQEYLGRVFKLRLGVTPAEYRRAALRGTARDARPAARQPGNP
jgi:LacI family transcriptional regulator